jgi:hypothetical protein
MTSPIALRRTPVRAPSYGCGLTLGELTVIRRVVAEAGGGLAGFLPTTSNSRPARRAWSMVSCRATERTANVTF